MNGQDFTTVLIALQGTACGGFPAGADKGDELGTQVRIVAELEGFGAGVSCFQLVDGHRITS